MPKPTLPGKPATVAVYDLNTSSLNVNWFYLPANRVVQLSVGHDLSSQGPKRCHPSMISQARLCFRRGPAFETNLFDPSDDNDTMRPRATAHNRLPWFVPSVPRLLFFTPSTVVVVLVCRPPRDLAKWLLLIKPRHYFFSNHFVLPLHAQVAQTRYIQSYLVTLQDASVSLFVVTACIDLAGCLCCGCASSCRIEVRYGSPTVVGVGANVEVACWLLRSR